MFAATLALGIFLLIAFDSGVQQLDADELVADRDDARAFLIADYFFIALYAVLSPLAIWRFGTALGAARPTSIRLAPLFLAAGGLFDAIENTLLLSATGSVSEGAVDAAHAAAFPKMLVRRRGRAGDRRERVRDPRAAVRIAAGRLTRLRPSATRAGCAAASGWARSRRAGAR